MYEKITITLGEEVGERRAIKKENHNKLSAICSRKICDKSGRG